YGGLVSVGQQAFIGLGAYGTVWLVNHNMKPYHAMVVAALFCGALAVPLSFVVLRFRGAAFAIGMWVVAEVAAIFVSFDQSLGAAGAMTLANTLFIEPTSIFGVDWTAYMIFMVLVGGLGTFEGPIVGALVLFAIQNEWADNGVWYLVGLGATAILFALLVPRGI